MADRAVIGYIHGGTVRAEFLESVLAAVMEGAAKIDCVLSVSSGPNISGARNRLAGMFLQDQQAPWLFMCDTDMWFAADTVQRLIDAADPVERPVVGGLCYSQNKEDPEAGPYSTMYELVEKDDGIGFARYKKWPEDTVVQVAATGAAALLIHRDVLERVEKLAGDRAAPWFRESVSGPALIGEDLTFCLRCAAAGIPVHVHTGVRVGHMKTTMLI